jgi:putative membrane protein
MHLMPFEYQGPGVGWSGDMFSLLVSVMFIAVVVWVILALAGERHHHHGLHREWGHGPKEPSSDALKILNERFARGEIDADEYTMRRDLLRGSS